MQQSLFDLLFPATRGRILALLILHPEQALHVRELARRTGVAAGTLARELSRLAAVGLLKREARGNQVLYAADVDCPIHTDIANLLRKTAGLADVVTLALSPLAEKIGVALIFGSQASGLANAGSDIDVLIVGNITFKEAVRALYPVQSQLGFEVNPKVFTAKEWADKRKAKDPFVRELLRQPKIPLIGNANDLAKPARR